MRVAMIGDYPKSPEQIAGGVEAVTLYLLKALELYPDLEMHMVTTGRRGEAPRHEVHGQTHVHYVRPSNARSRLSIWRTRARLRDALVELEPDLVHAHVAGAYSDAAMASGKPWVLTLHGIRYLEAAIRPGFINKVYRKAFIKREELRGVRRATHVISISPFIRDTFTKDLQGKVYDIENPIAEKFFNLPKEAVEEGTILCVGRLIPRKGIHTLLEAFAMLRQKLPDVKLRLAGGGITGPEPTSYYGQLLLQVERLGLTDAVEFLGELGEERVLEEYARCSVYVLSSILETAPMVILQALAAGKPVVTTDAGGSRHLVREGKTGHVVPIDDAPALAAALERVLGDADLRQRYSEQARQDAEERFRNTAVAVRTREVYYEVFDQTPP